MFPSLVAINGNKKVYQNLRGAFDQKSISAFLTDLLAGKGQNVKYEKKPSLDKTTGHDEL
jgi:protein disulfide-isomerase A6